MDKQTCVDGLQRIAARAMTEWTPDGITITSICAECIRARAGRNVADITLERAVRSVAEWFGVKYGVGELVIDTRDADEFWAEGVKLVTLWLERETER
jgi:hypothetical protein